MLLQYHSKRLLLNVNELVLELSAAYPEVVEAEYAFERSRPEFNLNVNGGGVVGTRQVGVEGQVLAILDSLAVAEGGEHPLVGGARVHDCS